jgi:tetratricopeptide (TPR) repeat protein
MNNRCPSCSARLADFAISCERCQWSLSDVGDGGSVAVAEGAPQTKQVPSSKAVSQGRSVRETELQLEKAMERIEKEAFEAAIRSINRAIIAAPLTRIGECYSLRGYCHLKLDDFQRAEKDCTEAIGQNSSDAQTYAWRAAARGEQNRWRLAFDDLDRAWQLSDEERDRFTLLMDSYAVACKAWFDKEEKTPDNLFEMGWVHFRRSRFGDAEKCFRTALEKDPDHTMASAGMAKLIFEGRSSSGRFSSARTNEVLHFCNVGSVGGSECQQIVLPIRVKIHRTKGDLERALDDLNLLAELSQDDSELAVKCCRLRYESGDFMVAIDELSKMLKSDPMPIEALLLRGDCYREIRNHTLALKDYSRFLKTRPDDPEILARCGEVQLALGDVKAATASVEKAIAIDETCFAAYICRSKIHLHEKRLDDAMTDCRKASLIDNGQPEVFATLASIYFKLGQYTESIEEYSRAVELEEDGRLKANLLYLRGIAFYELGLYPKSHADFKKACHLRPNHAGSWIWKSAACARLEKWTDAIAGMQHAIATRPSSQDEYRKLGTPVAEKAIEFFDRQQQREQITPDLYRRRALAFQFLGKFRESIEDYTNALKMEPGNVETLIRRGQALASNGDRQLAIEDFKSAIKRDKGNDQALFHLAQTRFDDGQYKLARRDIGRAIDSSPRNVQYYSLLADVLQKLGDHSGVVESLDRATLLDSTDPVTYRKRGHVHIQRRNYVNAISDLTRSLELNPTQVDVLFMRGQASLRANQPQDAMEDFERVLTLNSNYAKAYSGRAAALAAIGRHEYALIWLTKSFHRFSTPREISELVFARGKIFFQMGRPAPATDDFTSVAKLMEHDSKTVAAARYARGIARFSMDLKPQAIRDFKRVLAIDPANEAASLAVQWLQDPESCDQPPFLNSSVEVIRPTRPPVVRAALKLDMPAKNWVAEKPYDTWVLRSLDRKEFGPLPRETLNQWIEEGRIDFGMRLLRADWSKWKRAEQIFTVLGTGDPQADSGESLATFPNIASDE